MREIKFRARRIDNGRWVYGHYFISPLTDENSGVTPEKGWFFLSDGRTRHCISNENGAVFVIDVKTLGQLTNLKDKNGEEIYGDDFVQDHGLGSGLPESQRNNIGKVYQGEGGAWLWTLPSSEIDQIGGGETLLSVLQFNEAEVIGNIYENPELLNTD